MGCDFVASPLVTRNEAAALSGVSLKRLGREIEEGVIEPVREGARSLVPIDDVHLLIVIDELAVPLATELKRELRARLHEAWRARARQGRSGWKALQVEIADPLYLRLGEELARRLADAEDYAAFVSEGIARDPGIRGGEPLIAGTRVPVRTLAELIARGESVEVLREDYPGIPERAFRFAPLWARANPRRGRPRRPWKEG